MAVPEWRGQAFRYNLGVAEDKNLDSRIPMARLRVPLGVEAYLLGQKGPGLDAAKEEISATEYVFSAPVILNVLAEAAD